MKFQISDIEKIVEQYAPELRKLAIDIHDNPELGRQEFKACKWQTELLEKYGFEVETGYCDIETAYHAVYRGEKEGPKIAMLAEYDALPELGHGCGHNLIAMMSVGSGLAIKSMIDTYGGEIHVIGTPAEETEGAKVAMSKKGIFKDIDVAMMAHPSPINGSSVNTAAIRARKVEFFGRPAHAAGAPYEGLNALDAVINFFNLVNALRQQLRSDIRVHGIIDNGGVAPNIIPDYTSAMFYVRADKMTTVDETLKRVEACAEGAAIATGTTYKISKIEEDFKDTNSNMTLCELACQQYEKLGHEIMRFGKTTVPGSSDLGDVSYECPAIQLMCGMGVEEGEEMYGPHTVPFEKHAGSDAAIDNGLEFVKAFTMTAQELLTNPEHLEKIREEFKHVNDEEIKLF